MSHSEYKNPYIEETQRDILLRQEGYFRDLQKNEMMEESWTESRTPPLSERDDEADSHLTARYWG